MQKQKFTLVEMIAVIVILVILISIGLSGYGYVRANAAIIQGQTLINQLNAAIIAYQEGEGITPPFEKKVGPQWFSPTGVWPNNHKINGTNNHNFVSMVTLLEWDKPDGTKAIGCSNGNFSYDMTKYLPDGFLSSIETDGNGRVLDPWKSPVLYVNGIDPYNIGGNYPTRCKLNLPNQKTFNLWSAGPDGCDGDGSAMGGVNCNADNIYPN